MKRWFALVVVLAFMSGCSTDRTREFVAAKGPETFENWRIYVHVDADLYPKGSYTPANHSYSVNCTAWTVDGDVSRGPSSFRASAYFARIDSLKLTYSQGDDMAELPLDKLSPGEGNDPSRAVSLKQANLIAIPAEVRELQATVTMTFTDRRTDKAETKVFKIKMVKREGREIVPLTV